MLHPRDLLNTTQDTKVTTSPHVQEETRILFVASKILQSFFINPKGESCNNKLLQNPQEQRVDARWKRRER
jgi:hypothetical protein